MDIIKDGSIEADTFTHLDQDAALPKGGFSVSLTRWQSEKSALLATGQPLAVRVLPAETIEDLREDLALLSMVVIEMNPFTDGRSFTQIRALREHLGFRGEIRVLGDFLRDQMFFLHRLGANAFEFAHGTDLKDRLKAFEEFTVTYQAASDQPQPLFRRRALS